MTKCPYGTFSEEVNATSCMPSDPGYRASDVIGATSQVRCEPGTYQPYERSVECLDAPQGTYVATSGATEYLPCSDGTYTNIVGQSRCSTPEPGFLVNAAGTRLIRCTAGTYAESGATRCTPADPGYFVAEDEASSQTSCLPGTYQPGPNAVSCIEADRGHRAESNRGSLSQVACEAGFYQPDRGASTCLPTPPGTYTNTDASVQARSCKPGTYQPSTSATACLKAEIGTYVEDDRSAEATPCATGLTTRSTGSFLASDCMTIYEIEEANSDDSEAASVPPSNLPFTLAPGDINGDGLVNEVDETLRQMGITAEDYRNSQAEASEAVAEDPLPGLSTLSLIAVLGGAAVLRPKRHENA